MQIILRDDLHKLSNLIFQREQREIEKKLISKSHLQNILPSVLSVKLNLCKHFFSLIDMTFSMGELLCHNLLFIFSEINKKESHQYGEFMSLGTPDIVEILFKVEI